MTEKNRIRRVNDREFYLFWPTIEPLLQRVLDKSDSGIDLPSVISGITTDAMQLWAVNYFEAVVVTEIIRRPSHNVLFITLLCGQDRNKWLPELIDLLAEVGRDNDCKYIEFWGREGWEKVKPDLGFRKKYVVMAKEL